jgi:transposase
MIYYAALDVSVEETAICVVDGRGRLVKEVVVASAPAAIAAMLSGFSGSLVRVGLEVGPLSDWLYDGLRALGLPVVVIDALHASTMLKGGFRNKTDRNDARGLADMMRVGKYRAVWVKSQAGRHARARLAVHDQLVKTRTALVNTVRGLLRGAGIELGAVGKRGFVVAVRTRLAEEALLRAIVEPLLATLATVDRQLGLFDRTIGELVKADAVCRLLMTCPGVGPITAYGYRAVIDDPRRFRRSRDVGAYVGITPRRYQSGQIDYSGRISKMGVRACAACSSWRRGPPCGAGRATL